MTAETVSLSAALRLVDLPSGGGAVRTGVRRVAARATLPTAGALAALAGAWVTARLAAPSASGASSLVAAELATLAALTFPHAGVVALLDEAGRRS
jgi:hypothetical protein